MRRERVLFSSCDFLHFLSFLGIYDVRNPSHRLPPSKPAQRERVVCPRTREGDLLVLSESSASASGWVLGFGASPQCPVRSSSEECREGTLPFRKRPAWWGQRALSCARPSSPGRLFSLFSPRSQPALLLPSTLQGGSRDSDADGEIWLLNLHGRHSWDSGNTQARRGVK